MLNGQELTESYIYQVVRHLPKEQREDVRLELLELISDMTEQGKSIEAVLTELGDPHKFAKKYQNEESCLIGPDYYDTYIWFVKIVLLCTLIPVFAVSVIDGIGNGLLLADGNFVKAITKITVSVFTDALTDCAASAAGVFGAVTLTFAIMERNKVKLDSKAAKAWSVSDLEADTPAENVQWKPSRLSPVPDKRTLIDRSDSISSIVFIVIFSVLLIFAPHFFSAFFKSGDDTVIIHIFNLEQWSRILPVFLCSLLVGLADEILRLVIGVYCRAVMISSIFSGLLQIIFGTIVLKVLPLWNSDFAQQMLAQLNGESEHSVKIFTRWNWNEISDGILLGVVVIVLIEIATAVYKTLRYGTQSSANAK